MFEWLECFFACFSFIYTENKTEPTEEYKEININE